MPDAPLLIAPEITLPFQDETKITLEQGEFVFIQQGESKVTIHVAFLPKVIEFLDVINERNVKE